MRQANARVVEQSPVVDRPSKPQISSCGLNQNDVLHHFELRRRAPSDSAAARPETHKNFVASGTSFGVFLFFFFGPLPHGRGGGERGKWLI